MAELAYAIALGAIGETLGGSNPLPPITTDQILKKEDFAVDIAGVAQLARAQPCQG